MGHGQALAKWQAAAVVSLGQYRPCDRDSVDMRWLVLVACQPSPQGLVTIGPSPRWKTAAAPPQVGSERQRFPKYMSLSTSYMVL